MKTCRERGVALPRIFLCVSPVSSQVCMGMTLTLEDFKAVARRPKPVMAGVAAQYTVMVRGTRKKRTGRRAGRRELRKRVRI